MMDTNTNLQSEIEHLRAELAARTAELETLAQQSADLALLNELNVAANRGDSLADIISLIANRTSSLFNGFGVTVSLLDDTKTRLVVQNLSLPPKIRSAVEHVLGRELGSLTIPLTPDSLFTRAIEAKKPIRLTGDDILKMEREYAAGNPMGIPDAVIARAMSLVNRLMNLKTVLVAPLLHGDILVGVIDIAGSRDFSPADIARFDALAAQLTGIIARKQANAKLRQAEALYHSLVEAIPQNIFRKDVDGVFTFVNENFCRNEGKTADEILGKTDFDLHPPELAEKYRRDDVFVMTARKALEVIEEHQPRDGGNRSFVRAIKTPIFDADGEVIGVQGIFEDITLQKENEERLERYSLRLSLLRKIDRAILAMQSPADIARAALEPLLHIINARRASVVLLDEKTNTGRIIATAGEVSPPNLQSGAVFALADYPVYKNYRQSPDIVVQTHLGLSDSQVEQSLKRATINASLNVMLLSENTLIGALNFGFSGADDILPEYREIAREVGDSLAIALRQAAQTERIREESAAKTRLLQEVDHRVRNNLATIAGMIYLETRYARQSGAPVSEITLAAINVRVRALAALHELLATNQWQPLPLREVASRIFHATIRAINPVGKEFIVDISPTDLMVSPHIAQSFTVIFSEIVFRIATFALPEKERLLMHMLTTDTDDSVTLTFRVDGVPHPPGLLANRPQTVGMTLVTATVQQSLHGEFSMANDGSSAVTTIRFPKRVLTSNA